MLKVAPCCEELKVPAPSHRTSKAAAEGLPAPCKRHVPCSLVSRSVGGTHKTAPARSIAHVHFQAPTRTGIPHVHNRAHQDLLDTSACVQTHKIASMLWRRECAHTARVSAEFAQMEHTNARTHACMHAYDNCQHEEDSACAYLQEHCRCGNDRSDAVLILYCTAHVCEEVWRGDDAHTRCKRRGHYDSRSLHSSV